MALRKQLLLQIYHVAHFILQTAYMLASYVLAQRNGAALLSNTQAQGAVSCLCWKSPGSMCIHSC